MSEPDVRVERFEAPDGSCIYRANGKVFGPVSREDRERTETASRIADELGVPLLAIDKSEWRARNLNPQDEDETATIEEQPASIIFDESTQPHIIVRAILSNRRIVTLSDTNEMLDYDAAAGLFRPGAEPRIARALEHTFRRLGAEKALRISVMREIQERLKRRTYKKRGELNKHAFLLNLMNGMFDLRTFQLLPHDPKYLSTVQLPVEFHPEASCPNTMKFLSEVLYKEDLVVIQELLGYLLWKGMPAHKAWMLVGSGSNGKSTFIELIRKLLGEHNISSRGLVDLELNRFATADLFGKLANVHADLPDIALRSTGKFKMLTGGDPVTAEQKFKNAFQFVNYAKMVFSTNKIPEAVDDTDAFFRRWELITFPNVFTGEKEDRNLKAKLSTPEELSGQFNFAIEGLKRLQANNWHFSNPRTTDEIRREYVRKSSPIRAFLLDCTVEKPDGEVSKPVLYEAFCEYCREMRLPMVGYDTFYRNLPQFVKLEEVRPSKKNSENGKRPRAMRGISLRDRSDWGKDENEDKGKGEDGRDGQDGQDETLDPHLGEAVQEVHQVHHSAYFSSNGAGPDAANLLLAYKDQHWPNIEDYVEDASVFGWKREVSGPIFRQAEQAGVFVKKQDGLYYVLLNQDDLRNRLGVGADKEGP